MIRTTPGFLRYLAMSRWEECPGPGQRCFLDEAGLIGGPDGVTCPMACHQMADGQPKNVSALNHLGNTVIPFPGLTRFTQFWSGPLDGRQLRRTMRASYQPRFTESRFCASCHSTNNPDTRAPGQNTYTEWLDLGHMPRPAPISVACQDCHMNQQPPNLGPMFLARRPGPSARPEQRRQPFAFTGATPTTPERRD